MESLRLMCFSAVTAFALLAIPCLLAAQQQQEGSNRTLV